MDSYSAKIKLLAIVVIALSAVLVFMFTAFGDQLLDALTSPSTRHSGGLRLYRSIRDYVRVNGNSEITLGELMDFEWEYALIFTTGLSMLSQSDVSSLVGCDFSGMINTDTCGILFINDKKIVYFETHTFTTRNFGDTVPPRLIIGFSPYLREEIGLETRHYFFERNDIFLVGINERSPHRYHWIRDIGNAVVQNNEHLSFE